jgi:hypothetical protein
MFVRPANLAPAALSTDSTHAAAGLDTSNHAAPVRSIPLVAPSFSRFACAGAAGLAARTSAKRPLVLVV